MPAPITAARLETRSRERLARAESLLRQLERTGAPFTTDTVITPLNDLHVELHNLAAECGIYVAMHPDPEVQQLFSEVIAHVDFPIVITHRKPSGKQEEMIRQELETDNPLHVRLIFPAQGTRLDL